MTQYMDAKDQDLVELTLLGNEKAYEELVVRHERAVKGTAIKVTHNEYSAEDASQDAFVSAWMNLDSLRDRTQFRSWVCSIAKNCARNVMVRYKSSVADISFDLLQNLDLADSNENGLDALLYDNSRTAELHEAVEALSQKIRDAIVLHYFEGLSIQEIAEKQSLPAGTVKWRLSEGRKQLRKGFGVMEKEYNENESMVVRVMRQVEELKLWRLKNNKIGFENDYREVLLNVESLADSKEKSHAMADILQLGYWWLPGQKSKEIFSKIKQEAESGHNEEVMSFVMSEEHNQYDGQRKIEYMQNTQIPYLEQNGFRKALGYVLFWMGYEYRCLTKYGEAIQCFKKVMGVLDSTDVYYANAKAAIYCESRLMEALKIYPNKHAVDPSGEIYRYVGNKLYFMEQPGYGYSDMSADNSLFWNCSQCDGLIFDPDMKPGDAVLSSDGSLTMRFEKSGEGVDTPAGRFENCDLITLKGALYGLTYVETFFCKGIGIVKQYVERNGQQNTWALESYHISGGDRMVPLATGNSWRYVLLTPDAAINCDRENIFEVTGFESNQAAVASSCFVLFRGYADTWEGNIVKARKEYYTEDNEHLADVKPETERACALAETQRQKRHSQIVKEVMFRILDTDPERNPDYTQKGRWDFFGYNSIRNENGKVSITGNDRRYEFEWKDMANTGISGWSILYNFLYDILNDASGCVWSDEWIPGYQSKQDSDGCHTTIDVSACSEVIVPAGKFSNCRMVTIDRSGLSGGFGYRGGKFTYLFAQRVGMLKMVHPMDENTETVWELTKYAGTDDSWFPTRDGVFRRYEPKSLENGFHSSVEYTFDVDETGIIMFRNALGNQDRKNYEATASQSK